MPLIRSVEALADGVRIVRSTGEVVTLTAADIPSNVKSQSIASVQTWVNSWIAQQGWFAVCRITSVTPLVVNMVVSDKPLPAAYPV